MDEKKTLSDEIKDITTDVETDISKKKKILRKFWKTFKKPILFGMLGVLALLILIPILTYIYFVRDLTSKEKVINRNNGGIILTDRNDKPFFTFYEARTKKSIALIDIPDHVEKAVISVEDKEFYEHRGFSLSGIARAILTNVQEEQLSQGGSTISQQLVKNALLTQDKNFLRKYQELVLALELERRFSKDDILEMYLNTVYFGEGAFGIEDAALTYFGKNASELTVAEGALLAGILPAPSRYSPLSGDKQAATRRQQLVLNQMVAQKHITEAEKLQAENQELVFNPVTEDLNVTAPHFALMVKDELIKKYGEQRVARSGYKVKTTIDLELQEYADTTVANQVARLVGSKATNAAAVAMNPKNGEVLALVGSHDWSDETNGKINMALRPRQPGSSFKPLVYAKAFEERILTPASIIEDKQITFPGGYKPRNYDNRFRGNVTMRRALANSLNIPAVLALEKVGVPDAIDFAERLGITTLDNATDYGLSLILGAGEVPLYEMTGAYAVFANRGEKVTPTTVLEIRDKNNKVIHTHETDTRRAMSEQVAFQISSILSDNAARAEVFGGSLTISRIAAVKTGTTEDYKDALTIGYTPSLVIGVWVGNNDNTPMSSIAGSSGAAPIWRLLMERFLRGTTVEQFRQPFGLEKVQVCRENGLKVDVATSSAYTEYFLSGTVPSGKCNAATPTPSVSVTPTEGPTATPEPTDEPEPTEEPDPTEEPTPTSGTLPTNIPLP